MRPTPPQMTVARFRRHEPTRPEARGFQAPRPRHRPVREARHLYCPRPPHCSRRPEHRLALGRGHAHPQVLGPQGLPGPRPLALGRARAALRRQHVDRGLQPAQRADGSVPDARRRVLRPRLQGDPRRGPAPRALPRREHVLERLLALRGRARALGERRVLDPRLLCVRVPQCARAVREQRRAAAPCQAELREEEAVDGRERSVRVERRVGAGVRAQGVRGRAHRRDQCGAIPGTQGPARPLQQGVLLPLCHDELYTRGRGLGGAPLPISSFG